MKGYCVCLAFLVSGCAGGGHSKTPALALAAGIPASTVLHWTGGPNGQLSATEKDVVKIAGDWQFDSWTKDFAQAAPSPASIEFVNADELRPGVTSETLNGNMVTIVGAKRDAGGVYHELCHLFLLAEKGDQDAGHADPRWAAWDPQQAASTQGLLDWRRMTGALGPH